METQHQRLQQQRVRKILWEKGDLSYLLDETQKDMRAAFERADKRKFIYLCSRRLGKSYTLTVQALEAALRTPNTKIIYITTTYKSAKNIIQPLIGQILADAPKSCRPKFKVQDGIYVFPNGSQILLHGSDRDPDSLRGQEAKLIFIDEAGFCEHLDYMLPSVLMPMTVMTNGRILMATTPPRNMDHPFMAFMAGCQQEGAVIEKTVDSCPRITPKMREEYMTEAGGENSPNWRREYLLEFIPNDDKQTFPEMDKEAERAIVQETQPARANDRYVSMDLGFVDATAALFAYWDFATARLVIQDEIVISQATTHTIATEIKTKESALWDGSKPYKRVADHNNPQLIYDLNSLHGLTFGPANKDAGKEPMVNKVRLAIAARQIVIDPRCKNLIAQLKYCRWKGGERVTFDRSPAYGHFDAVDALIMLWSSVNRSRMPEVLPLDPHNTHDGHIPQRTGQHALQSLVKRPATTKITNRYRSW